MIIITTTVIPIIVVNYLSYTIIDNELSADTGPSKTLGDPSKVRPSLPSASPRAEERRMPGGTLRRWPSCLGNCRIIHYRGTVTMHKRLMKIISYLRLCDRDSRSGCVGTETVFGSLVCYSTRRQTVKPSLARYHTKLEIFWGTRCMQIH